MSAIPESFYCVQNIPEFDKLAESLGFKKNKIVSSRDLDGVAKDKLSSANLSKMSIVDNQFSDHLPRSGRIQKWAIPFLFGSGSAIFVITAEPHSEVLPHKHDKGFIRTVAQGELTITGLPGGEISLCSGEWIYIPADQTYGYRTGAQIYIGNCCYCFPK